MPPRIDAGVRRREVARIAARLVATRGADAVSLRSLAAEVGASTTVITHYFAGKADLLEAAYGAAVDDARERVDAVPGEGHPDRIRLLCEAVLPLDEPRRSNWLVWLAFMGAAISDPRMAALQRRRVAGHRELLTAAIRAAQEAGQVHPGRSAEEEARSLLAMVHGIASHAVFDLDDWPAQRQVAAVEAFCLHLAAPPEEGRPS
ncbi:TetR/AcrR family transcriptional regulator [Pseudonocardia zijingensis]|uniref:TetR/AcrR family transcriptional regulator n=1 Tax=Pseudonocardia zijingensis TaxID=153376 RepID=A0ABP4AEM5_9PSEU